MIDWEPILLTLKLALLTSVILIIISIPLGFWLSRKKNFIKTIIEIITSLPLVLPPTVLGFYLLIAFSPNNSVGYFFTHYLGIDLAFSFTGLVVGSVIYSLPFMLQPILTGFNSLPKSIEEASYTLGKSKRETLFKILIPNIKNSIFIGFILTFAHTIGEFGVVMMIGGNIPNETKVLSVAIYEEVDSLNYSNAHIYSFGLILISFIVLLFIYFNKNNRFSIFKS